MQANGDKLPRVKPKVFEQAFEWAQLLDSAAASAGDRQAFERWRSECVDNEQAWQRLNQWLQQSGLDIRSANPRDFQRRHLLRNVALAGMLVTTGWVISRTFPWQRMLVDYSTRVGERAKVVMPDNSLLYLNTNTAVDTEFTPVRRHLRVHRGEIALVADSTLSAGANRPFIIDLPEGEVRIYGNRFLVRADSPAVVALQDAWAEIRPRGGVQAPIWLAAGEEAVFGSSSDGAPQVRPFSSEKSYGWLEGKMYLADQRLAEVIEEVERYRNGHIYCHEAVRDYLVTGVLDLDDTAGLLGQLSRLVPVRITQATSLLAWVRPT